MPVAMLAAAFHDALEKRRLVGAKRRKEVCWYLPSIGRWKLWENPMGVLGNFAGLKEQHLYLALISRNKDMGPFYGKRDPYYSHIFRASYQSGMGLVWVRGPILGGPWKSQLKICPFFWGSNKQQISGSFWGISLISFVHCLG